MKLRKNKSPVWLSEVVQETLSIEYPELINLNIHESKLEKAKQNIPNSVRWAVIIFVLGLLLNEFFIWQGWIFSTYNLDSQRAADILASSIEYLAGLVGIILPIIFIIVEIVSKDKGIGSLVHIYLEKMELTRTTIFALILLAIEVAFMTIFRADIIKYSPFFLYFISLITLLNLSVIFETGKIIVTLPHTLSSNFLVETLSEQLTSEIRRSRKFEILYRKSQIINLHELQKLEISTPQPKHQQPQNTFKLHAIRSGVIEDIKLTALGKFAQHVKSISDETIFITKLVNDSIQEDETIAFIPLHLKEHTNELQKNLNSIFKLGKAKDESSTNESVKALLKQVKQTTEVAIREENKLFFDQLMSVYQQIFELKDDLPLPSYTNPNNWQFRSWMANQIIVLHLRDFVKISARSKNQEFISSLSFEIRKIIGSMIQNSQVTIDEHLWGMLNLYEEMYYFSFNHNESGISLSYEGLTQTIIDYEWIYSLNQSHKFQAVQNQIDILDMILGVLSRILLQAFKNEDLNTFKTLLNRMKPDELLAHLPFSYSREIITQREEGNPSTSSGQDEINEQIRAIQLKQGIQNHVEKFFTDLIVTLASYAVESYENGEIKAAYLNDLLDALNPYLPPDEKIIEVCKNLIDPERRRFLTIFHRRPDTKQMYSINDESKIYLFFCLHGMSHLQKGAPKTTISINLEHKLSRITDTCTRIANDSSKWLQTSFFIGLNTEDLSKLSQQWLSSIKKLIHRWQIEQDDLIIKSDLDTDKLMTFKKAYSEAVKEAQYNNGYKKLLGTYSHVNSENPSAKPKYYTDHYREKKLFTKFHEDNNDLQLRDLAKWYGMGVVNSSEEAWFQTLINKSKSLSTQKKWNNLRPYFERAINRFNENNYQISCLFVPNNSQNFEWFRDTPDFIELDRSEIAEEPLEFKGVYKNIQIYEYRSYGEEQFILALDLEKAIQFHIGKPVSKISPLNKKEIQHFLQDNPDKSQKDALLKISIKVSQPFNIEVLDRNAIYRMKIKLPIQ